MTFYEWFFLEIGRPAAGLFSWSHLLSVSIVFIGLLVLAFFLAKKYKEDSKAQRVIFLITSGVLISLFLMRRIFLLATASDVGAIFLQELPLFFCDIAYFVIPLIALTKGRVQDVCFDFMAICGFIMGIMGNYFAGNIFSEHPAFSYLSLISIFSHSISSFVALFIFLCGLNKMEKKNIPFTIGILAFFMTIALIVDYCTGHNFMFLLGGDGTPFQLVYDMVKGNLPLYQLFIYFMQCGYIAIFYLIYYLIKKNIKNQREKKNS